MTSLWEIVWPIFSIARRRKESEPAKCPQVERCCGHCQQELLDSKPPLHMARAGMSSLNFPWGMVVVFPFVNSACQINCSHCFTPLSSAFLQITHQQNHAAHPNLLCQQCLPNQLLILHVPSDLSFHTFNTPLQTLHNSHTHTHTHTKHSNSTICTNTPETTNFSTAQTPRFHIPTQHTALPS